MVKEVSLESYLNKKKKKYEKLKQEVEFLERIDVPVKLRTYSDGYRLLSEDYTLATHVKIEMRKQEVGSGVSYSDGGSHTYRHDYFPQFYFKIPKGDEKQLVYLTHEGFDKDENIIIRSRNVVSAWGDYSNEAGSRERYIEYHHALNYFSEKGVNDKLLKKLNKKILGMKRLS
ncbi:hypothetical protein KY321_04970 [Candidatus Woesearchaeota archaeon]|nr:hypothetical protein [Candidatus Woesearchaeota archaeon]